MAARYCLQKSHILSRRYQARHFRGILFSATRLDRESIINMTHPLPTSPLQQRPFTTDWNGNDDRNLTNKKTDEDDPFGVNFDDGAEGLGTTHPPSYKRDPATGRVTNEIIPDAKLSETEKKFLEANQAESDQIVSEHIENHWQSNKGALNELGQRVRESNMATNVLGRSPKAQAAVEELEDGSTMGRDNEGFSQPLTREEFSSFQSYMRKEHEMEVNEDDIPVQSEAKPTFGRSTAQSEESELALKWLTARAQRQMDDSLDDNPFSDLVPGDLNPSRLVNRKRAKRIPVQLLHHNNLALLQKFIGPAGLIRHRVQTRLGARDQRKISKLIKRARALGLLPYEGRCKVCPITVSKTPESHFLVI